MTADDVRLGLEVLASMAGVVTLLLAVSAADPAFDKEWSEIESGASVRRAAKALEQLQDSLYEALRSSGEAAARPQDAEKRRETTADGE